MIMGLLKILNILVLVVLSTYCVVSVELEHGVAELKDQYEKKINLNLKSFDGSDVKTFVAPVNETVLDTGSPRKLNKENTIVDFNISDEKKEDIATSEVLEYQTTTKQGFENEKMATEIPENVTVTTENLMDLKFTPKHKNKNKTKSQHAYRNSSQQLSQTQYSIFSTKSKLKEGDDADITTPSLSSKLSSDEEINTSRKSELTQQKTFRPNKFQNNFLRRNLDSKTSTTTKTTENYESVSEIRNFNAKQKLDNFSNEKSFLNNTTKLVENEFHYEDPRTNITYRNRPNVNLQKGKYFKRPQIYSSRQLQRFENSEKVLPHTIRAQKPMTEQISSSSSSDQISNKSMFDEKNPELDSKFLNTPIKPRMRKLSSTRYYIKQPKIDNTKDSRNINVKSHIKISSNENGQDVPLNGSKQYNNDTPSQFNIRKYDHESQTPSAVTFASGSISTNTRKIGDEQYAHSNQNQNAKTRVKLLRRKIFTPDTLANFSNVNEGVKTNPSVLIRTKQIARPSPVRAQEAMTLIKQRQVAKTPLISNEQIQDPIYDLKTQNESLVTTLKPKTPKHKRRKIKPQHANRNLPQNKSLTGKLDSETLNTTETIENYETGSKIRNFDAKQKLDNFSNDKAFVTNTTKSVENEFYNEDPRTIATYRNRPSVRIQKDKYFKRPQIYSLQQQRFENLEKVLSHTSRTKKPMTENIFFSSSSDQISNKSMSNEKGPELDSKFLQSPRMRKLSSTRYYIKQPKTANTKNNEGVKTDPSIEIRATQITRPSQVRAQEVVTQNPIINFKTPDESLVTALKHSKFVLENNNTVRKNVSMIITSNETSTPPVEYQKEIIEAINKPLTTAEMQIVHQSIIKMNIDVQQNENDTKENALKAPEDENVRLVTYHQLSKPILSDNDKIIEDEYDNNNTHTVTVNYPYRLSYTLPYNFDNKTEKETKGPSAKREQELKPSTIKLATANNLKLMNTVKNQETDFFSTINKNTDEITEEKLSSFNEYHQPIRIEKDDSNIKQSEGVSNLMRKPLYKPTQLENEYSFTSRQTQFDHETESVATERNNDPIFSSQEKKSREPLQIRKQGNGKPWITLKTHFQLSNTDERSEIQNIFRQVYQSNSNTTSSENETADQNFITNRPKQLFSGIVLSPNKINKGNLNITEIGGKEEMAKGFVSSFASSKPRQATQVYTNTTTKRVHGDPDPVVKIVETSYEMFSNNGKYVYRYESADGTKAYSTGILKKVNEDHAGEAVAGEFSYTDKEGNDFSISYTADENGYRPVGAHLPTPPPIPPAIARALAYLATKTTPEPVTESIKAK